MNAWAAAALFALVVVWHVAPAIGVEALYRVADMAVHDATGKRVSTVSAATVATSYPSATAAKIALRTDAGKLVIVTATGGELFGADPIYFTSADCTGRPFVSRAEVAPRIYGGSALIGDRKTLYVQTGMDREILARSRWRGDGTCETGLRSSLAAAPAAAAGADLADYFTPPFSLRATPGAPVTPGPAADREDLEPTDTLVVYDATGKKLGTTGVTSVFEPGSAVVAFVTGSGTIVAAEVTRTEIRQDEAFYSSTDCSGRPFLDAPANGGLKPVTAVLPPGGTVYVQSAAARTRTMWSTRNGDGDCASFASGRFGSYVPATSTGIVLAEYFTPPFSVRAGRATNTLGSLN